MFGSRFGVFADNEETPVVQQQVKKQAPKEPKKVIVKVARNPAPEVEGEEFQTQSDRRPAPTTRGSRGGERGGRGRGGRGGERGGRGGRGGRVERPRTGGAGAEVQGEDGERKPRRHHNYTGKPREEAHPFDKKSGTGRGRRDQPKGGHGKGNWGDDKKPVSEEAQPEGEVVAQEENKEEKPVEKAPVEEPVVEEEEVGLTLDDYLTQKQSTAKGLLTQNQARTHEKMQTKNVQANEQEKLRVEQIDNKLAGRDVYAKARGEGAELLGFAANDDDFEPRGGRGGRGRGGRDRPAREQRGGRGGRKGGKLVVDDNDFPAL